MEEVKVIMEGLDEKDISSILTKWKEIVEIRKQLDQIEEMLKNKVRAYMKERYWDKYKDDKTNISVTITQVTKETFNKKTLKFMLTPSQYQQVVEVQTTERLNILTPEARERLSNYVKR